jgi:hypothetical protein
LKKAVEPMTDWEFCLLSFDLLIFLVEKYFYIDVACSVRVSLFICSSPIQPYRLCCGIAMGRRIL